MTMVIWKTIAGRLRFVVLCASLLVVGCDDRSAYDRLVARELASGIVNNTLFLGYELGMPRDSFYEHSWDLNRQGLVMQGPRNQTVQFQMDDDLPHPAKMLFYPDFDDDNVYQMRVRFFYDGWAPWNKDLSADTLQLHVVDLFREWYGEGFIQHGVSTDGFAEWPNFVKVDGNRRIVVARHNDREVTATFTDLTAAKALEEENE